MNRIIGIAGYGGVGKDTLADQIVSYYGDHKCSRFAFADELKMEIRDFIFSQYHFDILNCEREQKEEVRDLLVFWGEKRRKEDPGYWLKKVIRKLYNSSSEINIITDVRYQNECSRIQRFDNSEVWLLERVGVHPVCKEEAVSIKEVREIADEVIELPTVDCYNDLLKVIDKKL